MARPVARAGRATTSSRPPCSQPRTRSTCTTRCACSSAAARSTSPSRSSSRRSRRSPAPDARPRAGRHSFAAMEASCPAARMRQHEPARLDPVARQRRHRPRAADDPHVRADAARGDRDLHLDHRHALRQPRRRLGPDLPLRRLGRRRRASSARGSTTSRRAGTRCPTSGGGRSRSGRAGSASGAGSPLGCLVGGFIAKRAGADVWLLADCLAPGPARGAGGRADRQLVEPGALREADRPALGPRDRPGAPAARVARPGDLPPGLPLRAALEPRSPPRCSST